MKINQGIVEGTAAAKNRWTIALAAAVLMLTIGTIYSWGIFTQPLLVAFHWDLTVATWAYAIANFSLAAIGAVIGGFWQDRVGPRIVAMVGVTLWGLGNVLAGLGTAAFGALWLYVSYGIIGGIGAGMAYITPLSMVTKWFPDKKGLAGGLVAGAFGLGAFLYNQIVPRLSGFHAAAEHAGGFIAARAAAKAAGTQFDPAALGVTFSADDRGALMHVFSRLWHRLSHRRLRGRIAVSKSCAEPASASVLRRPPKATRPRKSSPCLSSTCCGCNSSSTSSPVSRSYRTRFSCSPTSPRSPLPRLHRSLAS